MLSLSTHIWRMITGGRKPEVPPPKDRPYHHGDLRRALVRSARRLLREGGPEALTLRGVARAVGVSQAAPYRHFEDRQALVAAVAEEGFKDLKSAMRRGMEQAEGRSALRQVAVAYVTFAHAHPAEYRVMFGPVAADREDLSSLKATSRSVLDFVKTGIERLQEAGLVGGGDAQVLAVVTWSMLHGLVMLSLDGQTKGVSLSLDQLVDTSTHLMMFGMASRE